MRWSGFNSRSVRSQWRQRIEQQEPERQISRTPSPHQRNGLHCVRVPRPKRRAPHPAGRPLLVPTTLQGLSPRKPQRNPRQASNLERNEARRVGRTESADRKANECTLVTSSQSRQSPASMPASTGAQDTSECKQNATQPQASSSRSLCLASFAWCACLHPYAMTTTCKERAKPFGTKSPSCAESMTGQTAQSHGPTPKKSASAGNSACALSFWLSECKELEKA